MLAKLTSRNRLTLPKAILTDFEGTGYGFNRLPDLLSNSQMWCIIEQM